MLILNFIFFFMKCLSMMVCIPFLTLFERKILSYSQTRKGPKKVSFLGIFQPLADGVKLIMKEFGFTQSSKKIGFFISPMILFLLMIFSLFVMSKLYKGWSFMYSVLLFLVFSSVSVFSLFFSAISSKSKYTLLGAFRSVAQVISYEINIMTVILFPCCLLKTLNFSKMIGNYNLMIIFFPLLIFFWMISMLCETNRAPFDFSEGESELVSGFKTEYGSLEFTFLFLGEYGKMIILSILSSIMFIKLKILMVMFSLMVMFLFMWFRSTFPRFRYDLLMTFSWKVILPSSLLLFGLVLM